MKENIIPTVIILSLVLAYTVNAFDISPPTTPRNFDTEGVFFKCSNYNTYYATNSTLAFSRIEIQPSYVQFNQTRFSINGAERTNITLSYLTEDISTANEGSPILSFYSTSPSNIVYYNMSNITIAFLVLLNNSYHSGVIPQSETASFNETSSSDSFFTLKKAKSPDIDVDGIINETDISLLLLQYNDEGQREDINGDGVVNYLDRSLVQVSQGGNYR